MTRSTQLLRRGLLERRVVVVAGGAAPVARACSELGAETPALDADLLDEAAVAAAAALGAVDTLVCDGAAPFAAAGGGLDGLRAAVDGTFNAARAVARSVWIDGPATGKVVFIAPAPGAGKHAVAARAALDNLARTLSTEWARYGITVTTILPADVTSDDELAQLVAFLASPAGDYYSGCSFTLGAAG